MVTAGAPFRMQPQRTHANATTVRRNQLFEALRLVAALGVVTFHGPTPHKDVPYAGLVVFSLLSPLVDVRYNWARRRSPGALAKALLVPWVFWYAAYAALQLVVGATVFNPDDWFSALMAGPAAHLWFLPFIFVVLVLLNQTKQRVSERVVFLTSVVAALALLLTAPYWRALQPPAPWAAWLHATPAIFLGIALGLAERVGFLRFALVPLVGAVVLVGFWSLPGVSLPYMLGTASVLAVMWLGSRTTLAFDVEPLSRCAMGIYLVHPVFQRFTWPWLVQFGFPAVFALFCVILGCVFLARRWVPWVKAVL